MQMIRHTTPHPLITSKKVGTLSRYYMEAPVYQTKIIHRLVLGEVLPLQVPQEAVLKQRLRARLVTMTSLFRSLPSINTYPS